MGEGRWAHENIHSSLFSLRPSLIPQRFDRIRQRRFDHLRAYGQQRDNEKQHQNKNRHGLVTGG